MSIRQRIQILLAFLVGIPLLLLLFESYQSGRRMLVAEMKQQSLQIASLEMAKIDMIFEPARIISEGLVRSLETAPNLNPGAISAMLRRTLHDSPGIYGIAVVLNPALTKLGRYAPYAFRKNGVESEITLPYEYTSRDFYRLPVESGSGKWINPYYGEGGKALMVTYVLPVRLDGQIVGVAGVDLDLDSLLVSLHDLKPGGDGTVYLVNSLGRILAHPDLPAIADLPGSEGKGEMAALIAKKGTDSVKMVDPVSRKKSWIVESPISSLSSDRGGEDWSLIVSWPLKDRLASLNSMGRRMLVLYLVLGGGALWFLNRILDDTITRPLRRLAEQARAYAAGDLTQPPLTLNDALELREMGKALNTLGATLLKNSDKTDGGNTP